ncbi:unnamed protein product, partial [Ixodes persulcatus]
RSQGSALFFWFVREGFAQLSLSLWYKASARLRPAQSRSADSSRTQKWNTPLEKLLLPLYSSRLSRFSEVPPKVKDVTLTKCIIAIKMRHTRYIRGAIVSQLDLPLKTAGRYPCYYSSNTAYPPFHDNLANFEAAAPLTQ